MALVTALLLVGLFGAAVLAQVNAAPTVVEGEEIENQKIIIGAGAAYPVVATATEPNTQAGTGIIALDEVFEDTDDAGNGSPGLVYTALTANGKVARVDLGDVFEDIPANDVVALWWDALDGVATGALDSNNVAIPQDTDCDTRQARVGFSLMVDTTIPPDGPDNAPRILADNDESPPVLAADPMGLCQSFVDIDDPDMTTGDVNEAQMLIRRAFHWDMLTGDEMAIAAEAAGIASSQIKNYKEPFGKLSPTEQGQVARFFANGILAMGVGPLTLKNDGIDKDIDTDANTAGVDNPGEGEPGDAEVTVKVSDSTGRLIPSMQTVGQSFTATAVRAPTGDITPFAIASDSLTPANSIEGADSGHDVNFINEDTDTDPNTPARVEVRVGPGAEEVLNIDVTIDPPGTLNDLTYHHQQLNFSLVDGNNLDFVIEKLTMGDADDDANTPDVPVFNMAQIKKKSGVTLSSAQPYDFKLVVNEFDNAPNNSTEIPIRIVVVVDNVAPVFVANPESGTVAERARNWPIATFSASDTNNQVLRYGIGAKPGDAGAARILVSLKMGEFDGKLRTLTAAEVAKLTTVLQKAQPDYIEPDEEDDPATPNIDETDPASKDNEHVFVVSVNDGTSYAYHEFTLTVTDEDDPAPGSGQKLRIDEDEGEGVDNTFGTAPVIPSEGGTYEVGQQIDNLGNIAGEQSGNPEDVLFDIDPQSGALYLKKKGTIDFESGIVTYTLSISKGLGRSAIVVVSVTDVNEGPKFSKDDHERYDDTNAASDDDEIVLYVLESAAVDEIVKIGKDAGGNPATTNAIFGATDEDTKAIFRGTAYDFWYEGDTVDDDDNADNKLGRRI